MFLPSLFNLALLTVTHYKVEYKNIVPPIIEGELEKLNTLKDKGSIFCYIPDIERPVISSQSIPEYDCAHLISKNLGKIRKMRVSGMNSGCFRNIDYRVWYRFNIRRNVSDVAVHLDSMKLAYKTILYCLIRGDFNWNVISRDLAVTFIFGKYTIQINAKPYRISKKHYCDWSSACCKCNSPEFRRWRF